MGSIRELSTKKGYLHHNSGVSAEERQKKPNQQQEGDTMMDDPTLDNYIHCERKRAFSCPKNGSVATKII